MSQKHAEMVEDFEALVPEREASFLPASSLALNKMTGTEAPPTSIMPASLSILDQSEESEDDIGTATPASSSSGCTSATFMSTLGDNDSQSDFSDDHHHNAGEGEGGNG